MQRAAARCIGKCYRHDSDGLVLVLNIGYAEPMQV